MNISPCGYNFRQLMNAWEQFSSVFKEEDAQREKEGRVKMLVYGQNFLFFFRYKTDIYGGSEEARLTFATMRANEEAGVEEMMFGAMNLTNALQGKPAEEFFRFEDIDEIRVLNKTVAEELLLKHPSSNKKGEKNDGEMIQQLHQHRKEREKDTTYGLPKMDRDDI